jgi:protein-S-isoprenylcysteine O-methyltransferase Ste14
MAAVDVILAVGWIAFWLYWLAAAVGVKSSQNRWRSFFGVRLVLAAVVLALIRLRAFRGPSEHNAWLAAAGVALLVLGLGLAIWARINLGRNWGAPMSEKDEPQLVTSGPYRWLRNPIYSGLIVAGTGTALATNLHWLIVVALLTAYFVYSAVMEQRFLASRFPEQYATYKRSTKMLVPFVF